MHEKTLRKMTAVFVVILMISVFQVPNSLADATVMIGMGDSIGEGVQSADANQFTQPWSYLNLFATWLNIPYDLPLIQTTPLGSVGDVSNRSRLTPYLSASNIAVSGADVRSLLDDRADALSEFEINSETDLVLFPRLGSQIEIAESVLPALILCWIGNNDVLGTVTAIDRLDASQLTSVADFQVDFQEIVARLGALNRLVVFANIPDVTRIGILVDGQDLIKFLGSDFGLPDGSYTSMLVMLLMRLGLVDASILLEPDFVLDAQEVQIIQERIAVFNQIIDDSAASIGMPVTDIHGLFESIAVNPPVFQGVPLTSRFLGGLLSLDAVHPSNIGHALVANAFIQRINSFFGISIPPISDPVLEFIFLIDPFVDKDGDGIVTGRPGLGLLETLGPIFGISGDSDDSVPAALESGIQPEMGVKIKEQLQKIPGLNAPQSKEWTRKESMEVFKNVFGLRRFGRSMAWQNRPSDPPGQGKER
jgi:hypothetical protein